MHFSDILEGIAANNLFGLADLVIAGYFASGAQVEIAARMIDRIRDTPRGPAFSPRPQVVIDPIMGDDGKGLYVDSGVAAAIAASSSRVRISSVRMRGSWDFFLAAER